MDVSGGCKWMRILFVGTECGGDNNFYHMGIVGGASDEDRGRRHFVLLAGVVWCFS